MRVLPIAFAVIAALSATACKKSELTDADKAALVAQLPAPYNTADLANGKSKFAMCKSCHTISPEGVNMTGPALYGVFGRKVATKEQFIYSSALRHADFVWDADHLNKWLAAPRDFLPGTKMSFVGVPDAKDRIDLIAYLDVETHEPAPKN